MNYPKFNINNYIDEKKIINVTKNELENGTVDGAKTFGSLHFYIQRNKMYDAIEKAIINAENDIERLYIWYYYQTNDEDLTSLLVNNFIKKYPNYETLGLNKLFNNPSINLMECLYDIKQIYTDNKQLTTNQAKIIGYSVIRLVYKKFGWKGCIWFSDTEIDYHIKHDFYFKLREDVNNYVNKILSEYNKQDCKVIKFYLDEIVTKVIGTPYIIMDDYTKKVYLQEFYYIYGLFNRKGITDEVIKELKFLIKRFNLKYLKPYMNCGVDTTIEELFKEIELSNKSHNLFYNYDGYGNRYFMGDTPSDVDVINSMYPFNLE